MNETIQLGEISILVTRKAVKNVHLSVHPPEGRVTLVAPSGTRLEVARAYAISKLSWIRAQQKKLDNQARETPSSVRRARKSQSLGSALLVDGEIPRCQTVCFARPQAHHADRAPWLRCRKTRRGDARVAQVSAS